MLSFDTIWTASIPSLYKTLTGHDKSKNFEHHHLLYPCYCDVCNQQVHVTIDLLSIAKTTNYYFEMPVCSSVSRKLSRKCLTYSTFTCRHVADMLFWKWLSVRFGALPSEISIDPLTFYHKWCLSNLTIFPFATNLLLH